MKKNHFKFSIFTTLSFVVLLLACSSNEENQTFNEKSFIEQKINSEKFNLQSKIVLKQSTDLISDLFFKLGVSKIDIKNMGNYTSYTFQTEKSSYLGDDEINFSDYEFIIDGEFAYEKNSPDNKITLVDNELYVVSSIYQGKFSEMGTKTKSNLGILKNELSKTIVLVNELTTTQPRNTYSTHASSGGIGGGSAYPCSGANTTYVTGMGFTNAAAIAEMENAICTQMNAGKLNGCRSLGSAEQTNYGIITTSTKTYCCDGPKTGGAGGCW